MSKGRIYLVDNDDDTTKSLSEMASGMELPLDVFSSGHKLIDTLDLEQPGCVIAEIRIPDIGGLQLQRRLANLGSSCPLIFVTAHWTLPIVVRAMKAGAFSFFEKPLDEDSLWETVQAALCVSREKHKEEQQQRVLRQRMAKLNQAERCVLDAILQGLPNRIIAEEQDLSLRTIELRRKKLMTKLKADSLADLIRIAMSVQSVEGDVPSQSGMPQRELHAELTQAYARNHA